MQIETVKSRSDKYEESFGCKEEGRHVGREAEYSAHRTGYADQSVQCNHIYRDSIIILPALRKFRT